MAWASVGRLENVPSLQGTILFGKSTMHAKRIRMTSAHQWRYDEGVQVGIQLMLDSGRPSNCDQRMRP
jgi:hypothetical protein